MEVKAEEKMDAMSEAKMDVAVNATADVDGAVEMKTGETQTISHKKFALPHIGARMIKSVVAVFIVAVAYEYLLGGRNACFACVGAVYGVGSVLQEGARNGFNRFVGTLLGGLVVIPFYWLYANTPLGIPSSVYLCIGLFFTIYLNVLCGTNNAIQPGTIVYFVVIFTQPPETYIAYTIARVIDTGIGVIVGLIVNAAYHLPKDRAQEVSTEKAMYNT